MQQSIQAKTFPPKENCFMLKFKDKLDCSTHVFIAPNCRYFCLSETT